MSPAAEPTGRLVLVRHGETEWSRDGRHTGRTDVPLTADGERDARLLAPRLAGFDLALVLCSPLARARRTAELAGLDPAPDDDLVEWDYGGYEGRTTSEIRECLGDPGWTVFDDGVVPGDTPGETVEEVAARASRVLDAGGRAAGTAATWPWSPTGTCCASSPPPTCARTRGSARTCCSTPAALCVLDHERGVPAVRTWNETTG